MSMRTPAEFSASPIEQSAVMAQLERILTSSEFATSERRRNFLRFIVEETLAGRANRIKGYTIATKVFGRSDDFDPRTDPTVRLEARRLRRDIEHFYLTEGRDDPVKITIPKGSYVPVFETSEADELGDAPTIRQQKSGSAQKSLPMLTLAALAIAMLAIVGLLFIWQSPDSNNGTRQTAEIASDGKPVIAVLPFRVIGEAGSVSQVALGVSEDIITDLTRVGGLRVIAHSTTSRISQANENYENALAELNVTHILQGTLQTQEGKFRLNAGLVSIGSGEQIWAERFDYSARERFQTQTDIARSVSNALSVAFLPEESAKIERGRWLRHDTYALYTQGITIINPPSDRARFDAARILMKRIIELEPDASHGYSGLALIEAYRISFGHTPNEQEAHKRVRELADKALSINPDDARAFVALSISTRISGDRDRSVEYARQAVDAQPSFSRALSHYGVALTFAGRAEEGVEPVQTAYMLDPASIRQPYLNMLSIAQYHAGYYEDALDFMVKNLDRGGPYGPHMMVYHAAILKALDNEPEMNRKLRQLNRAISRGFSVKGWLNRLSPPQEYLGPLLALLELAEKKSADAGGSSQN
ncbi:MAG: tetratricopeptide repeat protein [Rhizobiaceae bacterium]